MNRKETVLLIFVLFLAVLLVGGCQKRGEEQAMAESGEERAPAPESSGNVLVEELTNPDEALLVLTKNIDQGLWGKYLNKDDSVPSGEPGQIGFALGVRSANSLLAVFLEDYATAESLAKSLQGGAEKLNIQSSEIEATASELAEDLKVTDEEEKKERVKSRLNILRDQVVNALEEIGNDEVSVMVQLGAWFEGMRQVSGLVMDDYSQEVSQVLLRGQEIEFFKKALGSIKARTETKEYDDMLDALSSIQDVLQSSDGKVLTESQVKTIHSVSAGTVESTL